MSEKGKKQEQAAKATQEEPQKARKEKKSSQQEETGSLPFLLELVFSSSFLVLLLVDLAVAAFSWVGGASLMDIFIRVVVSTFAMGLVLWLLAWQMSNGMLEAAYTAHLEARQAQRMRSDEGMHAFEAEA